MMPGPAPVMTMKPALTIFVPNSTACLIFELVGLGAGGAEDGDFALVGVGREEPEGIAQFARRRSG